ncbi:hypothetical protein CC86DRAFT_455072 [Ophiobolus disseminans]|uniref:Uncharacterized protein n=1 Tax=Ophiobolus disseminans TaxID=1469910 RepID=A0A6A7A2Q3_9PLEO|nr:hypothetical protein CC86DRAFT_455072 [Ophiobolus disseminans]
MRSPMQFQMLAFAGWLAGWKLGRDEDFPVARWGGLGDDFGREEFTCGFGGVGVGCLAPYYDFHMSDSAAHQRCRELLNRRPDADIDLLEELFAVVEGKLVDHNNPDKFLEIFCGALSGANVQSTWLDS